MSLNKNITVENFNKIERYLGGEMSLDEKHSFEIEINNDPYLKDALKEVNDLEKGVEIAVLKEKLDEFHSSIPSQSQPVKKLNPQFKSDKTLWFSIAAILVVALGVFWVFSSEDTNEKLFAKHFTPDPGLPTVMGANENFTFNEAMVAYKLGNYSAAINTWNKQLTKNPQNDTLQYFLGAATLANGKAEVAIPYFKEIVKNSSSAFQHEANFYLGLAFLKEGNSKEAQSSFLKSNLPEAQEILEELNP